jgi:hypothetical protein
MVLLFCFVKTLDSPFLSPVRNLFKWFPGCLALASARTGAWEPICQAQITMQASKHRIPKTPATEVIKTFKIQTFQKYSSVAAFA